MKRRKRTIFSKERIVMAASSVIVLGALTATGLWMGGSSETKDEGYVVDLSTIENETQMAGEQDVRVAENITEDTGFGDDLDYDPYFQETNSAKVENPDQSKSTSMSEGDLAQEVETAEIPAAEETETVVESAAQMVAEGELQEDAPAISTAMQPTLSFSDDDTLVWPIVGNVLINFSMDKTIYFKTLDQYKYNPAIVIQANEGDMVTAAAAGKVTSVFEDAQIGNGVKMDLGNGYEVTYGQLQNILVSEGSYVSMGDLIAEVAAPTKYYSVEGTNVYFMLTKDGEPVNPMSKLHE